MTKILQLILRFFAKKVLKKYKPQIIGITGSVGKTSAKEAVFAIISKKFRVRRNIKNYNNELGLPLTILGKESGSRNIIKWLFVFIRAFRLLLIDNVNYPEVLILEMAADRPGDINYLTKIAKPNIAIITAIGSSHIQFFGTIENIIKEKSSILKPLTENDWAVLNYDDAQVAQLKKNIKSKEIGYGQNDQSQVRISNVVVKRQGENFGTFFELHYQNTSLPVFLPNVLGQQHALVIAAAVAVALIFEMSWDEIKEGILNYQPALGRTNLIKGIKGSWIIDDTYNASPQSSKLALQILKEVDVSGRRIVVFGDMLELGETTEEEHRALGKYIADLQIDYLFVVGERARDIRRGAIAAGMDEDRIYHFPFTIEAGLFLQDRIKEDDFILVKGSRGAKMEQIVYEIMARPWEAEELLVGPVK